MRLSLEKIARMIGGAWEGEQNLSARFAEGYSIDTRTLRPGELFFAVRGETRDGHQFVGSALASGAVAAVVARKRFKGAGPLLIVDDPEAALGRLAAQARVMWGGRMIAITGSNGKTTTKGIVAALLATRFRVAKSEGNLNNQLGLPLSILRMPDEAQIAVMELGMNHAGEIRSLAQIARPDVGVVTNVNPVHLENFASVDGIALAKRELIEALPADGVAVLNADDERVSAFAACHRKKSPAARVVTFGVEREADVRAVSVVDRGLAGFEFQLQSDETRFRLRLAGRHNVYNVLAGLAVAKSFDIRLESLCAAVSALVPARMRGEMIRVNGMQFINDCYNSNPRAAESMLDLLAAAPARRRVAVLGEMLELGDAREALHREVGKRAAGAAVGLLVGVHGAARQLVEESVKAGLSRDAAFFFEDAVAAGEFLRNALRPGDVVLFKASRGVKLEKALEIVLSGMAEQGVPAESLSKTGTEDR